MFREISPLDGRYRAQLGELGDLFSEFALVRERCRVELLYLLALEETGCFPSLDADERERVDRVLSGFSDDDFKRVRTIEQTTHHDVKACELFLREALELAHPEAIHFGLTSADVSNLAYARLITRYRDTVQVPQVRRLIEALADRADRWADVSFPAFTHGQPASPTTVGKELAVFVRRLLVQAQTLESIRFYGKLNGATGTYAAPATAAPDVNWPAFSQRFVEGMGLAWNDCTTQVEPGDRLAEYFGTVARINNVLLDLDVDLWEYISRGLFVQHVVAGEVGSSTMPHKVNPVRFENSEGNGTIANALLRALSDKLTHSRMQRDLSGSTVMRNIGVALAHSYLAVEQTTLGLSRIDVDRDACRQAVDAHPEVLAEAIQTILRAEGIADAYELLKGQTRGKPVTVDSLRAMADGLNVGDEAKQRIRSLDPATYVGLAETIARRVIADARAWLTAAR